MLLKICGAGSAGDVELLGAAGADLVGLWHGVPGGRADLSPSKLSALASAARRAARPRPVLVTFRRDADGLREALAAARIHWIQLHGYQPPGTVRALKDGGDGDGGDLTVVKVVHLDGESCPERSLIPAYERAGTDVFLVDAVAADGRIGSTGQPVDPGAVLGLVDRMSRPFLLAGGVRADNREEYRAVLEHPLFLGIDVDTAARDADGRLRADRVRAVSRGWRPVPGPEAGR
ncbi:N-(5'-phosphoribosyl)anthranilate isomerase [Streptomyces clavuligerus]|uniref:N-(5'-phosphoribosyl)anthranilate isomerase n=1 Tax=Streptomyces clavuligerus TaxID=1901 RepID=B5H1H0_STRCL|nr:N-(5'-phosphoribosyl)anthranilate isomerase [Streptomyces clavuligerus]EDY52416.1 hypothetical protein SSCG_05444 [Streptomyces clavuligerus]EFG04781.1 PRAI domain-containing protein [Streptomyces clavuligerus]MBY6306771.1 N-(5'-phosphoribosyl)anthranilate isomerase [Streptomyces clavuligerus]QCS10626.1 N-(5'-phosphoribosyl)anthranilate isomerase [Streptomyces clavuligerus]QPJ97336.1 N-(5'-phosphoribosyl)anthranilate isomerase [Streptomyces clavuligerus]